MAEASGGFDWFGLAGNALDLFGNYQNSQNSDKANRILSNAYGEVLNRSPLDAAYAQNAADPYAQYRAGAAQQLNGILDGSIDFRTDPGYQFSLDESNKALERAAASRGYNHSGNVLEGVSRNTQSVASREYNNIVNRLTGLAGATPQNAIAGGQSYSGLMGDSYNALLGQAQAQGAQGSGQGKVTQSAGGLLSSIPGLSKGGSIFDSIGGLF